jgi:hypothetical protein
MSVNIFLLAFGTLAIIISFKYRTLFLTKNIFLLYVYAIYLISPLLLGNESDNYFYWFIEFVGVFCFFILGHQLALKNYKAKKTTIKYEDLHTQIISIKNARNILLILVLINFFVIAFTILSVGSEYYFSGSLLTDSIENYGKSNNAEAAKTLIYFLLSLTTLAIISIFIERHIDLQNFLLARNSGNASSKLISNSKKSVIKFTLVWFLLIPLLHISRGEFVLGLISLFAVFFWSRIRASLLIYLLGITVAITTFVFIGQLRQSNLDAGAVNTIQYHLASELTPWIGYNEVKKNIDKLNFQYGKTLIIPFFVQFIPRGFWTEKPINTSAYFNTIIYGDAADAGFMLPITIMGVLYLNFGFLGVITGVFILGIYSGAIDSRVCCSRNSSFGFYLIGFTTFFSLLRNDTSVALFQLISCFFIYFIIKRGIRL